jgi:hypothetical protein
VLTPSSRRPRRGFSVRTARTRTRPWPRRPCRRRPQVVGRRSVPSGWPKTPRRQSSPVRRSGWTTQRRGLCSARTPRRGSSRAPPRRGTSSPGRIYLARYRSSTMSSSGWLAAPATGQSQTPRTSAQAQCNSSLVEALHGFNGYQIGAFRSLTI